MNTIEQIPMDCTDPDIMYITANKYMIRYYESYQMDDRINAMKLFTRTVTILSGADEFDTLHYQQILCSCYASIRELHGCIDTLKVLIDASDTNQTLEKATTALLNENNVLKNTINELQGTIDTLKTQIYYQPTGQGAVDAQQHFTSLCDSRNV